MPAAAAISTYFTFAEFDEDAKQLNDGTAAAALRYCKNCLRENGKFLPAVYLLLNSWILTTQFNMRCSSIDDVASTLSEHQVYDAEISKALSLPTAITRLS